MLPELESGEVEVVESSSLAHPSNRIGVINIINRYFTGSLLRIKKFTKTNPNAFKQNRSFSEHKFLWQKEEKLCGKKRKLFYGPNSFKCCKSTIFFEFMISRFYKLFFSGTKWSMNEFP